MLLSDLILSQGRCAKESSINDKNDWATVSNAFSVIDFTEADLEVRTLGLRKSTLLSWSQRGWAAKFHKENYKGKLTFL